jgi:hypothetical protein
MFKSDEEIDKLLSKPDNLATELANRPTPRRVLNDLSERKDIRSIMPDGTQILEAEDDEEPEQTVDATTVRPMHNGGRRLGDNNIPHALRVEIALAARTKPIAEVAKMYDISEHHAFELSKGMTSYEDGKNDKLIDSINGSLAVPNDLALAKLTAVLTAITPDKIGRVSKVKDLATIASQLANVAKTTLPIIKDDPKAALDNSAQLVVYAPNFRQENHYETVRVERPETSH